MPKSRETFEGFSGVEGVGEDLSLLLSVLKSHNDEHGYGARVGKTLGSMLRSAVDSGAVDAQKIGQEIARDVEQGTQAGLTALNATHQTTLEKYGLALMLEPARDAESEPSGEILLLVVEPERFVASLSQFSPGTKDALVSSLAKEVQRQVRSIDFENLSDDDSALLDHMPEVATALRSAGPSSDLGSLERYGLYARDGRLDAYLAVEREGLWQKPGEGFGPADWVGDSNPESLARYWDKALTVLASQDKLGSTGLGRELRDHLLSCMSASSERLASFSFSEDEKAAKRAVLATYTKKLIGDPIH